jgi:hypothetical protein
MQLYRRRLQELEDELERALAADLEIDEGENQSQCLPRRNFLISV